MSRHPKMLTMMRRLPVSCVSDVIDSPVGELRLIASDAGLNALFWAPDYLNTEFEELFSAIPRSSNQIYISMTKEQLGEYFLGRRKEFEIPLVMDGTDFQIKAWNVLRTIPYGKTISYQEQAIALSDKNKVRAVGSANGRNPISIIVPCHRVIGKNGGLHGFGGGLDVKKYLIELEENC